jgi:very-short-patch-repair endonuclease
MLITTEIEVKWHGSSRKHYIDKGYKFTKTGDYFVVRVGDLSKGTHQEIIVKCDYQKEGCEDTYSIKYTDYLRNNINANIHKDCCKNPLCMKEKRKESLQKTYGYDNVNQIPEVKEKRKQTCQELYNGNSPMCSPIIREKSILTLQDKYNVHNISQVDEIKNKKVITVVKNYGVENPAQSDEIRDKIMRTNKEKYGVSNYTQTDEYKSKVKQTNQEKYGVDYCLQLDGVHEKAKQAILNKYGNYPMLVPEIKEKVLQSLYKNNTAPRSIQQEYLSNLYQYSINYLVDNCFLDMVDVKDKIYVEYDGGGHDLNVKFGKETQEQFNKKEIRRSYFLKNKGYKIIRIISTKDKLPLDDTLLLMLDYAKEYLSTNHSWIHFDIDNQKIITSQYIINVDYGKLRKIKSKDIEDYKQYVSL